MGIKVTPEESAGLNPHIKEGNYLGRLAGIRERTLEVREYDDKGKEIGKEDVLRWDWTFGVRTKEEDVKMTLLTSPKMTTRSKAFGFARALRGGEPVELGIEMDTDNLVGLYASLTVKDKSRQDRTGNVQLTSEITDMVPVDTKPEVPIEIDGLVEEEEQPEPAKQPVKKTGRK